MNGISVPEIVAAEEKLARYILQSNHIRKTDNTVKQDAFIPHPYDDLSVTRHLDLEEGGLWTIGAGVAQKSKKTFYGRADNDASDYLRQKLHILSDPVDPTAESVGNPNHAVVKGWPPDKPSQKMLALEIASRARYTPVPD